MKLIGQAADTGTGAGMRTDEICQGQVLVRDDALDLVELRQMSRVHRLVTEHPVNRE